jgi:glycerophosphoryl diester phosphodiesterase
MTIAVAHRGDPLAARENTLAALESAVARGADMVELDCRVSADGQVVLLHDDTFLRLWGVNSRPGDLSWAQIRSLGSGAVRVPLLADALDRVPVEVMVDAADAVALVAALDVVRRAGALGRCLFVGDLAGLLAVRDAAPAARIGLTWTDVRLPDTDLLHRLRPEYFNPYWKLVNASVVAAMHRKGLAVSAWTVDDPEAMATLAAAGVDALISNQIGCLVDVLRAQSATRA